MLLAAPATHLPLQGTAPVFDNVPMTVQLAPVPALVPVVPEAPDPGARRTRSPTQPSLGGVGSLLSEERASGPEAPALPPAPDPHYYPARDLDSYPRPLTPLRLDRPTGELSGEVRLEVLIDEYGVVREVVLVQPARSHGSEEELRATLAATSFVPARKDGRPVRSRILLGLNPGAEER
jgi:protein TonB